MTTPTLSEQETEALRRAADLLIPRVDGLPSASDVGVHRGGLRRVLAAQPELGTQLGSVLSACAGCSSPSELREATGEHFQALCELIAGAYFTEPAVLKALDYPGRPARALPDLEAQERELVALTELLVKQGARWRKADDVVEKSS